EGSDLPAYFLRPGADRSPRKTLLIISGFDGTAEESYFHAGAAAVERGYNALLFEGPGKPAPFDSTPALLSGPIMRPRYAPLSITCSAARKSLPAGSLSSGSASAAILRSAPPPTSRGSGR